MTVYIATLGCKVNQNESSAIAELFEKSGACVITDLRGPVKPDVCVVNSCAVTRESERKSRARLSALRRAFPDAVTVLCGCMPQVSGCPEGFGADITVGVAGRSRIPELVRKYLESGGPLVRIHEYEKAEPFERLYTSGLQDRTRAFLKIEDGCDRCCAYCIIPRARGPVRSMPLGDITGLCGSLTAAGHKEIVLSGINLASYGKDTGHSLADAVRAAAAGGAARIRLGSMEADLITDSLLDCLGEIPGFCPQFHLSAQSGSDAVLKRMNRKYSSEDYLRTVEKIRGRFENPSFTTDVMVGFPQESDEEFSQTVAFVKRVGFARLHIFPYSPRPQTPAALMPQVAAQVKKARAAELALTGRELAGKFAESQIGTEASVLFETCSGGLWFGHSKNYTRIYARSGEDLSHRIARGVITGSQDECCFCDSVEAE